ncbi:MAG: type II toxin-antitoxin system death-on-curing family toxin [Acidobacteriota bacterium]
MKFPRKKKVLEYHAWQIERFGGSHGLRDEGALESSLIAPQNRFHYEGADLATCAATYAYHLSQAHAFIDGNKRIAAAIAENFLEINGAFLRASDEELEEMYLGIAAGHLTRDEVERLFANWIVMAK